MSLFHQSTAFASSLADRPVTKAHVYATLLCTMVSPTQFTVSSVSGFLALANFPLLNVNFDVIDGAVTAWMAYSFCISCPTLFIIILAEFDLILEASIIS